MRLIGMGLCRRGTCIWYALLPQWRSGFHNSAIHSYVTSRQVMQAFTFIPPSLPDLVSPCVGCYVDCWTLSASDVIVFHFSPWYLYTSLDLCPPTSASVHFASSLSKFFGGLSFYVSITLLILIVYDAVCVWVCVGVFGHARVSPWWFIICWKRHSVYTLPGLGQKVQPPLSWICSLLALLLRIQVGVKPW